jgi:hypothetical protein
MIELAKQYAGGCLCGALRYLAQGQPRYAGHCYCKDCRKASGSGFIPFLGFARSAVTLTGESTVSVSVAANGGDAHRNRCARCGSLVFGGERDRSVDFTIYAGSLDDAAQFVPSIAIFTRGRPAWASIPAGLRVFERGPA